jgi:glycosyltransferase involved in cell wall biosynthesis
MNVSIIVPTQAAAPHLGTCLEAILTQRYDAGRIEVLVAQYGGGKRVEILPSHSKRVRLLAIDHPSPYAARNLAVSRAGGDLLLFTEADCVPDRDWVRTFVERFDTSAVTVGVGHVAASRSTHLLELFNAYEDRRDTWVFSSDRWSLYFGRPKNMAIARRRFDSHGPFVEVLRGADSKFVQRIAREVSCDEIQLVPDAVVRQLSIRGLPSCFRDRFDHGLALEKHQSAHAKPISLADRRRILRETANQNGYGPLSTTTLVALLAAGIFVFRLGSVVGRFSRHSQF